MTTYRIFDCTVMTEQTDIIIFAPFWIVRIYLAFKGSKWDYQKETSYQKYYERAALNR